MRAAAGWSLALACLAVSAFAATPATDAQLSEEIREDVSRVEARAKELSVSEKALVEASRAAERPEETLGATVQDAERTLRAAEGMRAEAQAVVDSSPTAQPGLSIGELLNLGATGKQAHAMVLQAQAEDSDEPPPAAYRLYVSRSMGEAAMRSVIETAKANPDLIVVFRGLMPGEKIMDLVKLLSPMLQAKEGEPVPNIVVDPTVFSKNAVDKVPRLEKLDDKGDVVAYVHGVINPRYLSDRIALGERGAIPDGGEVTAIAEEDLIEVLKRKVANHDWKGAAERGAANLWRQYPMVELPHATEARKRTFDPTVVVTETITAPDGTVLAVEGEHINPFDTMPFSMKLVVIDGTVREHLVFAREIVRTSPQGVVMVVTTRVDRERGWESFTDMVRVVQQRVFLLQDVMIERFGLERVPAVVEGGDRVLIVNEYVLSGKKGDSTAGG